MSTPVERMEWRRNQFGRIADALKEDGFESTTWWGMADRVRRTGSEADEETFISALDRTSLMLAERVLGAGVTEEQRQQAEEFMLVQATVRDVFRDIRAELQAENERLRHEVKSRSGGPDRGTAD